ncbi:MAG: caspase family protein [Gemmatimonadota bacterium]|nr:caspase family protein [Gemmatimonadota bacterium]MDQ8147707.1 caspase family protein [Gemmatimonadota bacterium]MDQ8177244.1 caspase family protein [Gemmatimonadota bacterium]
MTTMPSGRAALRCRGSMIAVALLCAVPAVLGAQKSASAKGGTARETPPVTAPVTGGKGAGAKGQPKPGADTATRTAAPAADPALRIYPNGVTVLGVAYAPNGQRVATAAWDKKVRLIDPATGAITTTLAGHDSVVAGVAFSPNGQLLASASWDNTVRLWDPATGRAVRTLTGHRAYVRSVAFSPNGQLLASAASDNTVRLWNPTTGATVRTLTGHSKDVWGIAFSPDGRYLASGSWDQTVKLWEVSTGALVRTMQGHTNGVYGVAFTPDSRTLISAAWDRTLRVWDPATGETQRILSGHTGGVWAIAISPDGAQVASGAGDSTIRVWSIATGTLLREVRGHTDAIYGLAYAPTGALLLSGSRSGRIGLWDGATAVAAAGTGAGAGAGTIPAGVTPIAVTAACPPPAPAAAGKGVPKGGTAAAGSGAAAPCTPGADRATVSLPAALQVDSARFTDTDGDNRLGVGERAVLQFVVRNVGPGPATGVQVQGTSTQPIEGLRSTLGRILPGESRSVALSLTAGATLRDTTAELRLEVREANGFHAEPLLVRVVTRAFRPPVLAVADVGVEDAQGRSIIRTGQVVTLTIRVQNTGEGRATGVTAEVAAGPNVFLADTVSNRRVRRVVGDLEPGAFQDVRVQAFANTEVRDRFPITVALTEASSRFAMAAKDLGLALETPQRTVAQLDVTVRETAAAAVASGAAARTLASTLLQNIPLARDSNPDAIAIIIGNRSYQNAPAVAFASNDAAVMKQYAERALGIRPGNVFLLEDATLTNLKVWFGDQGNPNGRLKDLVKPGRTEVFVFYSGHGAPDPRAERAYLMPADADANRLSLTGLPVDMLYENLAALNAKHVTVVLDACFSGASGGGEMLITSASPIGMQVRDPAARFAAGNATIIAAAEGQQLANWYPEMRHGMLTYFFLKGLQGGADANRDGRISVGEIRAYLTDPADGLPYEARRVHGREQTPQVFGREDRIIR